MNRGITGERKWYVGRIIGRWTWGGYGGQGQVSNGRRDEGGRNIGHGRVCEGG